MTSRRPSRQGRERPGGVLLVGVWFVGNTQPRKPGTPCRTVHPAEPADDLRHCCDLAAPPRPHRPHRPHHHPTRGIRAHLNRVLVVSWRPPGRSSGRQHPRVARSRTSTTSVTRRSPPGPPRRGPRAGAAVRWSCKAVDHSRPYVGEFERRKVNDLAPALRRSTLACCSQAIRPKPDDSQKRRPRTGASPFRNGLVAGYSARSGG
jgi:hypothetical protein